MPIRGWHPKTGVLRPVPKRPGLATSLSRLGGRLDEVELCNSGSTMVSDYCDLPNERLPEALGVIAGRGEAAVEDCELLEELVDVSDPRRRR